MSLKFHIYDVFTSEKFKGNPLAIVKGADGLSDEQKQVIAREFNLSETIFLSSSENPVATAKVSIFTPTQKIPFAGHPLIGAAIHLAGQTDNKGDNLDQLLILESDVGNVRCGIKHTGDGLFAEFDSPQLPVKRDHVPENDLLAAALGVSVADIGFENHKPMAASSGIDFVFVPIKNLMALRSCKPDLRAWQDLFKPFKPCGLFAYCRETVDLSKGFHARMFAPDFGIMEDAATGSAAVAFAWPILEFEDPRSLYKTTIEQGHELDRQSLIHLQVDINDDGIRAVHVGGQAVELAEGKLV